MISKGDGRIVDRCEPIWSGLKRPFKKRVVDTQGARGGLVRGWCDGSCNLFLSDRREVTDREGWGVIRLDGCDLGLVCNEELLLERSTHLGGIMGESGGRSEKGGNPFD